MEFGFFEVVTFFGGLGLFLFGMKIMADALEKAAGGKLQKLIESMTGKLFKGVIAGTVVTAIIQSSSATTVMVVGFVNAGIMKLGQAVGVIMGANIGTTITAQIIRLGDLDKSVWYLKLFNPSFLAPACLAVGVVLIYFAKQKKLKDIGEILAGFGALFIGMQIMEDSVRPLRELQQFQEMFSAFGKSPMLGVLAGAVVTAIIQSSSASIGILQAVAAATGLVTYSSAVPIILGQNIGTCITAILSSIGTSKNAKRAAAVHLLFNLIGSLYFIAGIYIIRYFITIPFWDDTVNMGGIANFHTIFNVINMLIFLPFAGLFEKAAKYLIRDKCISTESEIFGSLDPRFLNTPAAAITRVNIEISKMIALSRTMFQKASAGIMKEEGFDFEKLSILEDELDSMEAAISQYMVKIAEEPLSEKENKTVSGLFHLITDVERIGDHCLNLAENAVSTDVNSLDFTAEMIEEIKGAIELCGETLSAAEDAYNNKNAVAARKIQALEDIMDLMKETFKVNQVERIAKNKCDFKSGVTFLDIMTNLERIADHCSNIGITVEDILAKKDILDPHNYLKQVHKNKTAEYMETYDQSYKKYSAILEPKPQV